jgi:hypothetical protein
LRKNQETFKERENVKGRKNEGGEEESKKEKHKKKNRKRNGEYKAWLFPILISFIRRPLIKEIYVSS